MAVLSESERAAAWRASMDRVYDIGAIVKADLRAAIDAVDQWADDNTTSFNTAIPQPARGVLTAKQKAALLMIVVGRRHGVL